MQPVPQINLNDQINLDQKRYSRYVCDSRAIPNMIDGLKPVQRRILWTMWNTQARDTFTKTVKVTGLVMGYHPHGDASISDALCQMAQQFTFANNYSLVSGDGTFGDVLDPKAIASSRYTEVKLSHFAKDVGLFESIPDLDYVPNYDATSKEPVFFVPKIPTLLLNPILGIATGFRCNIPGHRLTDVAKVMIAFLQKQQQQKNPSSLRQKTLLIPWYRGFKGVSRFEKDEQDNVSYTTGFGFHQKDGIFTLVSAPQGWNREKTILYLEDIVSQNFLPLRGYKDLSRDTYQIEFVCKRGATLTLKKLQDVCNKTNKEVIVQNVITPSGKLMEKNNFDLITEFIDCRKEHLKKRFKRLSALEKETIDKHKELIRFIGEKWPARIHTIANKRTLESNLQQKKFYFYEWLSGLAVYRMTQDEIKKAQKTIDIAKKEYETYRNLYSKEEHLTAFMIKEIRRLAKKWDADT